MKKTNRNYRRSRLPMLSIISFTVIAACVYGVINIIARSIKADADDGVMVNLLQKLTNMDFIAAVGFCALTVIFICVQIINYQSYVKPYDNLKLKAEQYSIDEEDALADCAAIRNRLGEGRDTANRLLALSWEYSEAYRVVFDDIEKSAASIERLFADSAAADGTAARLVKTFESRQHETRQEIIRANSLALNRARVVEQDLWRGSAKKVFDVVKNYIREAGKYLDLLDRERELVAKKINAYSAVIEEAGINADRLSLNAAMEAAKIGATGRIFAFIADDFRAHADVLRNAYPDIREAAEQMGAQAALADELKSLYVEAYNEIQSTLKLVSDVASKVKKAAESGQQAVETVYESYESDVTTANNAYDSAEDTQTDAAYASAEETQTTAAYATTKDAQTGDAHGPADETPAGKYVDENGAAYSDAYGAAGGGAYSASDKTQTGETRSGDGETQADDIFGATGKTQDDEIFGATGGFDKIYDGGPAQEFTVHYEPNFNALGPDNEPTTYNTTFDWESWNNGYLEVRGVLSALRSEIRALGAFAVGLPDASALLAERGEKISMLNRDLVDGAKSISTLMSDAGAQLEAMAERRSFAELTASARAKRKRPRR